MPWEALNLWDRILGKREIKMQKLSTLLAPAVAGCVASIAAWLLLGRGMMLIPAMVSIVLIFICSRKYFEKKHAVAETEEQK